MTTVSTELKTIKNYFAKERKGAPRKHKSVLEALISLADRDAQATQKAIDVIGSVPGAKLFRRAAWLGLRSASQEAAASGSTLSESLEILLQNQRRLGQQTTPNVIGTTLLVKGLEFEHAIVPDISVFDPKQLYVAITRGSRSLCLFGRSDS